MNYKSEQFNIHRIMRIANAFKNSEDIYNYRYCKRLALMLVATYAINKLTN